MLQAHSYNEGARPHRSSVASRQGYRLRAVLAASAANTVGAGCEATVVSSRGRSEQLCL